MMTSWGILAPMTVPGMVGGFDEPWTPSTTPSWFWRLVDLGNDLLRRGLQAHELADKIDQAIEMTGDTNFKEAMDLITNHLRRAWHIEGRHLAQRPRAVLGDPQHLAKEEVMLVEQVVHTLYSVWLRDRAQLPDPDNATNSSDEASCSRSRSPTPRCLADDEEQVIDDAASFMEHQKHDPPPHKRSPTRLWRELPPERRSSEVRRLTPPWKKQNNPPLQAREPREPSRSPPRAPPKPKPMPVPRCPREIPAPTTPQQEPGEEEATNQPPGPMDYNDAIATWQALLEWSATEGLEADTMPVLPQHVMDNMVETLVDKPLADHDTMMDTLPAFMARVQQDLYRAASRARALRNRLSGAGSSTDAPPEPPPANKPDDEEEDDDCLYMQTTIDFTRLANPERESVLDRLQKAFNDLDPARASSRAIRLFARLQDYDGHLTEDRQALEALLVTFSTDTPPKPEGEECILEWAWVGTWWRRLTGQPEHAPDEVDADLRAYEQAVIYDTTAQQAEEAHQAAAEQQYLQGLTEAVQHHQDQLKSEEARTEDENAMQAAMGLTWAPPAKRLCIGICVTDGRTTKAWDWELDRGAEVQIHVKATKKDCPGQWYRNGKRLLDHEVPETLRSCSQTAPAIVVEPRAFDMRQPATQELFRRWQAGLVSDQTVVATTSTDMLASFQAAKQVKAEDFAALDQYQAPGNANQGSVSSSDRVPLLPNSDDAGDGPNAAITPDVQQPPATTTTSADGPPGAEPHEMAPPSTTLTSADDPPSTTITSADDPPGAELSEVASAAVGTVETENNTAVDPASDVSSNACTYYNGRRWSEKYGYPVSDTSSLDRSD